MAHDLAVKLGNQRDTGGTRWTALQPSNELGDDRPPESLTDNGDDRSQLAIALWPDSHIATGCFDGIHAGQGRSGDATVSSDIPGYGCVPRLRPVTISCVSVSRTV
jgi:hypothetical protein